MPVLAIDQNFTNGEQFPDNSSLLFSSEPLAKYIHKSLHKSSIQVSLSFENNIGMKLPLHPYFQTSTG